jgi:WD40 repeat protein
MGGQPDGLALRYTLKHHKGVITRLAWSPAGRALASGDGDSIIQLWNGETGAPQQTLKGHSGIVYVSEHANRHIHLRR